MFSWIVKRRKALKMQILFLRYFKLATDIKKKIFFNFLEENEKIKVYFLWKILYQFGLWFFVVVANLKIV